MKTITFVLVIVAILVVGGFANRQLNPETAPGASQLYGCSGMNDGTGDDCP